MRARLRRHTLSRILGGSLALMLTGGASYIALVVVALWLTGDA